MWVWQAVLAQRGASRLHVNYTNQQQREKPHKDISSDAFF